jgi:hypothetical protein
VLTPKAEELVATPYRDRRAPSIPDTQWQGMSSMDRAEAFFIDGMKSALGGIYRVSLDEPIIIYYAFK